jgi:GT2 family glycosyltransferase
MVAAINPPGVSFIIVNWNGLGLLPECLQALEAQSFQDCEIIVVDNGSGDGSVAWLQAHCRPRWRLIFLPHNTGFGYANNVGIRESQGEWVALINNDTVLDPDWLALTMACAHGRPLVGMVGGMVLNYYHREVIDNTGHLIYPDGLNRGRDRLERYHGQSGHIEEILFPSACAALYRKTMLMESGLFDESFFAYGDDTDIGLKGRLLGYVALYCPQAIAYHKYSQTAGAYSATKAFLVERNRLWVLVKFFPLPEILASPWYTIKRYLFQAWAAFKHQGASGRLAEAAGFPVLIKITLKSYLAAAQGLPQMLQKRREINRRRRVSPRQFRLWLKRYAISAREIALKE